MEHTDVILYIGRCIFMSDSIINLRTFNLFWLDNMKEHAIFIYTGLPHERWDLLEEAKKFEIVYNNEHRHWKDMPNPTSDTIRMAISNAISLTEQFIRFKSHLFTLEKNCQLGSFLFPLELDHFSREAKEYLSLLNNFNKPVKVPDSALTLKKELFWLGIMGDHASFIAHFLDPTVQNIIHEAQSFANYYYTLLTSGKNLMEINPITLNLFTDQIFEETTHLKDWKTQLTRLRKECQITAIVPTLFFDHIKREADYFLKILKPEI